MVGSAYGVLVGYDGSADSEQALSWAAREARSRGSMLTICQAWAPGYPASASEVAAFDLARRCGERILAQGLRSARAIMGSGEVQPLLAGGQAASVLCEHSTSADMVVVSSRGHGGLAGLRIGSVSSQVAAHAHGRVVVVRGRWRPAGGYVPGPIVVGADGSAASQAAVAFAFEEAALREAPLLAVCALADAAGSLGSAHRMKEKFEQAIPRWEQDHPNVAVHGHIASRAPRAALLTAAGNAQLLILGARGLGGIQGMMLGAVSQAMLHHSPCPVSVVHPQ